MSTQINLSKRIAIKNECVTLTPNVNSINFEGTGINATTSGDDVTVTVPGSYGSTIFYLNESVPQAPYKEFSAVITTAVEQIVPFTVAGGVTTTIASYQTPSGVPGTTLIPGGFWQFYLHFNATTAGQNWIIRPYVYKRDLGGIETLILTSDPFIVTNMGTTTTQYTSDAVLSSTSLLVTDRLVVKIDMQNTTGVSQTANFRTEGSTHYSVVANTLNQNTAIPAPGIIVLGSGTCSTMRCGVSNTATGACSAALSGSFNLSATGGTFIAGGQCNIAGGCRSAITAGFKNLNTAVDGFIGGGNCNNTCNFTNGCLALGAVVTGGVGNNTTGGTWDLATCTFSVAPTICNAGQYSFIGGGFQNKAVGQRSVIAGGSKNTASGSYSTVSGGNRNTASCYNSTVSGGFGNTASCNYSTVGGGLNNTASCYNSTVSGGRQNTASANDSTVSGGYNNTASCRYSTVSGGRNNLASGLCSTIGGGHFNTAGYRAIVGGGSGNSSTGSRSTVSGGYQNTSSCYSSAVGGGVGNTSSGRYGTISGGRNNVSSNFGSSILGGCNNTSQGVLSTIGGGICNSACNSISGCLALGAVVVGGVGNNTTGGTWDLATCTFTVAPTICNAGQYSFVGGGFQNRATGTNSAISGGTCNTSSATDSFVGGGCTNVSSGLRSTIGGGLKNLSQAIDGFIGGGNCNNVCNSTSGCLAYGAVVVGGVGNNTTGGTWSLASCCFTVAPTVCEAGRYSFIGSGLQNHARGPFSFIGGGCQNKATLNFSGYQTVLNGLCNTASGVYHAIVTSGWGNTASGQYATVFGGAQNTASASYTFIAGGRGNIANQSQSFILGVFITSNRCCTTFVNNLSIMNIPTSSAGLPSGAVWRNGNVLNIV